MELTQDELRNRIRLLACECEEALRCADHAGRFGTVRQRLEGIAFHQASARLFADCAFTWATMLQVAA